jgi:hypothetical protein
MEFHSRARDRAETDRQAHRQRARAQRKALKRQYKGLFAELTRAFFEADPAGISVDSNTDEYEPEVGTVLPRLSGARSAADVKTILVEEFNFWFEGSYDPKRLAGLSETVWQLWSACDDRTPATDGASRDIRRR